MERGPAKREEGGSGVGGSDAARTDPGSGVVVAEPGRGEEGTGPQSPEDGGIGVPPACRVRGAEGTGPGVRSEVGGANGRLSERLWTRHSTAKCTASAAAATG